jgi:hypothetical protein
MANPCDNGRSTAADVPPLLPERAFVVEFSSGGETTRNEHLSGRVEHVVSGQAARFASAGELLEFVHGVLRSGEPPRKKAK